MKRLVSIIAPSFLFLESRALAAGASITLPNPLKCTPSTPGGSQLECVVEKLISGIFTISVPIVSIMVLYAGFQFITSGGDTEKVKKARQTITYAIVGFMIVLIAQGLVALVRNILTP